MGRFYSGDIEGKFWFGVQSSDDADFFGVHCEPTELHYYFGSDDLEEVKAGLLECEAELGDRKALLDKFFTERDCYSDRDIEALGIPAEDVRETLCWYARWVLGDKIRVCIETIGECSFYAEI